MDADVALVVAALVVGITLVLGTAMARRARHRGGRIRGGLPAAVADRRAVVVLDVPPADPERPAVRRLVA